MSHPMELFQTLAKPGMIIPVRVTGYIRKVTEKNACGYPVPAAVKPFSAFMKPPPNYGQDHSVFRADQVISAGTSNHFQLEFQTAVAKIGAAALATHPDQLFDLEYGISVFMGDHFWPAADLAPTVAKFDLPEIKEQLTKLYREITGNPGCQVHFYNTGNSFHAYVNHLMHDPVPAPWAIAAKQTLASKWMQGLASLSLVDQKWVKFCSADRSQGVLRWSAGRDRCIPTDNF